VPEVRRQSTAWGYKIPLVWSVLRVLR